MKYYVDQLGRYLGGWDANPPAGAIEVSSAPEDARQLWRFPGWGACPEVEREQFKRERTQAVAAIKVQVAGMVFDGDEVSQTRMARSVAAMNDGETIPWVLADNTPVQVTRAQLREALRLAGQRQAELWVQQ